MPLSIKLAHKYDKKVIIDPKGKNWEKYSGADIVTPNVKELSDIVGYTVPNTDRAIEKAAGKADIEQSSDRLISHPQ